MADNAWPTGGDQMNARYPLGQLMTRLLILLIKGYRLLVSPWLAPRCRFLPSCSEYAITSLGRHGVLRGGWLAVRRLARCHPWGGSGIDEVPEVAAVCRCGSRSTGERPLQSN